MARRRVAISAMRLNTGPATTPPKYGPALGALIITTTVMTGLLDGMNATNDEKYFSFEYFPLITLPAVPVLPAIV